jgi:C4-dicarboxylate transporter, DctQ subunit
LFRWKGGIGLPGRIFDKLLTAFAVLAGLLLLFITFTIGYTILARVVGLPSIMWEVQFNEYALVWITFLGSAWALAGNKHVSIDLFTRNLGPRKARWMSVLHNLMGIAVCGVLFWYCTLVVYGQYQRGVIDVQTMDVPKYLVLLIIPIGFLLLALQFVRSLIAGLITPVNKENSGAAPPGPDGAPPQEREK